MHVHTRDDLRVDGILRLIELAAERGPLTEVLGNMVEQVKTIAHAEVVSVYVRENDNGQDRLVLRANVGFPRAAVGAVSLAVGEGITGTAAEVMRPISASVAQEDSHYKHIPELGEEHFPSLLAIPLMVRAQVAGVLVLQRGEQAAFTDAEVALGTALATAFAHALEHRDVAGRLPARSARLSATVLSPGTALGQATMFGTLESFGAEPIETRNARARLAAAFEGVESIVRKGLGRVREALPAVARGALDSTALMLDDQRLRTIAEQRTDEQGIANGLRTLAREYAVATYSAGAPHPLLEQRAIEAENLCLLLAVRAAGLPLPSPGQVIVVAERLTAFTALAAVGGQAEAVVAAAALEPDSLGAQIAVAAGIPLLSDIAGLFAWVMPDDVLLVDGDAGLLRVNPPATTLARYRHLK